MRLAPLARRTAATLVATALLTTGGTASGLLVGIAHAADTIAVDPKFKGNTDTDANNTSLVFTYVGGSFDPAATTRVELHTTINNADYQILPIAGSAVTVNPKPNSPGQFPTLTARFDLRQQPPSPYSVKITQTPPSGPAVTYTCSSGCFNINGFKPTVSGIAKDTTVGARADHYIVSGTDFADLAKVTFEQGGTSTAPGTPDPAVTFVPDAGTAASPNPTANSYAGTFSASSTAVGGVYDVGLTNTDGKRGVCLGCLVLPTAKNVYRADQASVLPLPAATLGQGAVAHLIVSGAGFGPGTTASFAPPTDPSSPTIAKIHVNKITVVSATTLDLAVDVDDTYDPNSDTIADQKVRVHALTLGSPGVPSSTITSAVTVSPRPTIAYNGLTTGPSPSRPGRASTDYPITITGTGLQTGATVSFVKPDGITFKAGSFAANSAGTSATFSVSIDGAAPLEARNLVVTNPDLGVDTGSCLQCLTPIQQPLLTSVSPPSVTIPASGSSSVSLTLNASNLTQTRTSARKITFPTATPPAGSVTLTNAGISDNDDPTGVNGPDPATQLYFTVNIPSNAPPGPQAITYTDGDGSVVTCAACFTLDNLAVTGVSPFFATNDQPVTLHITGTNFATTGAPPTVTLQKAGQPDLVATSVVVSNSTTLDAVVDITNASPDASNVKGWAVRVTNADQSTGILRSAFTVIGNTPTFSTPPLTPSSAPASSTPTIAVKGTNFARGAQLSFSPNGTSATNKITVLSSVFGTANTYQFKLNIPSGTALGPKNVTFTNSDGKATTACNACFSVNPAPAVSSVTPASRAPGSAKTTLTVTDSSSGGTAYNGTPVVTFDDPGITVDPAGAKNVSPKSFQIDVTVTPSAAVGKRAITVTNPDGGTVTCTTCFSVAAVPTVATISPALIARGANNVNVTVTGKGFGTNPSLNLGNGITVSAVSPSTDGTSLTAVVSVASTASPRGFRDVSVTNNDSTNGGTGTRPALLGIGDLPAAPTLMTPGRLDRAISLAWTPGDDGGIPITGYTVTVTKTSDGSAVSPTIAYKDTTALVSGLVNGTSYTFVVKATNGLGTGPNSAPKTGVPAKVPDAPKSVSATPGDRTASVTWSAVTGAAAGGDPVSSYTVTATPADGTVSYPADRTLTGATFTGLTNGTQYTFTVVATNGVGSSMPSDASAAITPSAGLPGAPTALAADPAPAAGSVRLSWTASTSATPTPTTSYVVRVSTAGAPPSTVMTNSSATSFDVSNLNNGTAYTFEVAATNGAGTGAYSAPASATPYDVPGQVQGLTATGGDAQASFSWSAPATDGGRPVTGYTITLSPGGASQTVTTTSATFTGLTNGTTYTASVVATNARGNSAESTTTVTPARVPINGGFNAVTPARILDTRSGLGAPAGAVSPGGVVALQVAGVGGVPSSGVSAVALNVTAVAPQAAGFVTVYPSTDTRPTASNLNFTAGRTVPNVVVVPLGTDGQVALYNGSTGTTQLLADVAGYYLSGTPSAPGSFSALTPSRVLDTRNGTGAAKARVGANGTVRVPVLGSGGVPSSGVSAVVLNVTGVAPAALGYVTAYPSTSARPTVSNLNFTKGQTIANLVVVPVGTDGKVALFNGSAGAIDLLADVAGYYLAGTPTDLGSYAALTPARILDTRSGNGAPKGAVVPSGRVQLQVTGRGGVPSTGVAAVVLNVTAVSPTRAGYLTAFPNKTERPTVSNLNFVAGQTVPNLVIVPVGSDGKVALFNGSSGTVQMLADVAGYYLQ